MILETCADTFMTAQQLADALGRSKKQLQEKYLTPMLRKDLLERKFEKRSHHGQAYRAKK